MKSLDELLELQYSLHESHSLYTKHILSLGIVGRLVYRDDLNCYCIEWSSASPDTTFGNSVLSTGIYPNVSRIKKQLDLAMVLSSTTREGLLNFLMERVIVPPQEEGGNDCG